MPNEELVVVLPLHVFILSLYFSALLLNGSMKSRNLAERRSWGGPLGGPSAGEIHSTHFGGDHQRAIISKHQGQLFQNELEIFQKFSLLLTCSLGSVYVSDCCNLCKFFPRTCTIPASVDFFGLLGHICFVIYRCFFFSFGWLVQLLCSFFNLWCLFLWEKYLNYDIIFILMLSTPLTTVMWLCLYIIVYN